MPWSPITTISKPQPEPGAAWHEDLLGAALVGGGAVMFGVSAGVFAWGTSSFDDLDTTRDYDLFGERLDRANSRRKLGSWGMAFGGALIAAGVVRYIVVSASGGN